VREFAELSHRSNRSPEISCVDRGARVAVQGSLVQKVNDQAHFTIYMGTNENSIPSFHRRVVATIFDVAVANSV
jgi:hypothetical protein